MGCDTSQTDQSLFYYLKAIALFVMLLLCIHQAWGWCVPNEWQKLLASDGVGGDWFGMSVAISGNVAVVGGIGDDDNGTNSGSAYVFRRDGLDWIEEVKLLPIDGEEGDAFGRSVAISGDIAIIGATNDDDNGTNSGSAYIFRFNGSVWEEEAKLLASDGTGGDGFGISVAISGTTAVIGALGDDDNGTDSGSAYLFDTTTGQQLFKLLADDGATEDEFGYSVAISGTTAIVGAYRDDDNGTLSGSAYLFDTLTGQQITKLLASDNHEFEKFGFSVAISGSIAIIGALGGDGVSVQQGSAYIFRNDGSLWIEDTKLIASDGASYDKFGCSVAISGSTAIVGARECYFQGEPWHSGTAYVYRNNGSTWVEEAKLFPSDGEIGDEFGFSVAIGGTSGIVGSWWDDDNGSSSGSAYIFHGLGDLDENGIIDICDIDFDGPVEIASIGDPTDVVSTDFDGDGDNDIAIAELGPVPADPGYFVLLRNDGSGTNFTKELTGVGPEPTAFTIGDFDGINGPDAAVTNSAVDSVSILLNDGTGLFTPQTPVPVGDNPSDITSGDFNGDTFIDLAVTNRDDHSVTLLFNDGTGTFTPQPPFAVEGMPSGITAGTFDDDATIDLIIACEGDDTVRVYANDGTGGYVHVHTINVGPDPGALDPEDLDGDSDLDVVVGNHTAGFISYLLNDGDGNFTRFDVAIGIDPSSLDAVDLDHDDDMDIIVAAGVDDTRAVRILRNDLNLGQGLSYTLVQDVAEDPDLKLTTAKDLDADNLPDIIAVNGPNPAKYGDDSQGSVDVLLNALATPCDADLNEDDQVDIDDIFAILGLWGDCDDPCPPCCTGDLTEDCTVNIEDIFAILGMWGPCM